MTTSRTRRNDPRGFTAVLLALSLLMAATAVAQESETPAGQTLVSDIEAHEIQELTLEAEEKGIALTLEDAISHALEHNLSLVVERYRRTQSLYGVLQNLGIYDFTVTAFADTGSSTFPQTSLLEQVEAANIDSDTANANASLIRLTPIGGTATLSWNNSRRETNNQTSLFNPQFQSVLNLNYVQPLLRNFGRLATERNLIRARNQSQISEESFEIQVSGIIQQISDGYWDLVESREQLKVSEESLNLAKELHEMNRIQVEVGTLAPLEMVQSEASVASREEEIIRRRSQVGDNEDRLRQLINLRQGMLWDVPIVPATEPEAPFIEISLDEAIETALSERPEIRSKIVENENLEVDYKFFKNQQKPQLDITANYGQSGVGGDIFQELDTDGDGVIDTIVDRPGGYGDALDQLSSGDAFFWSVALNFRYAIQNRSARAQKVIAELALEQGEVELDDLELQVLTEVRQASRAVRTATQQIEAAKVASRLAEKNLEAEQKRYENGLSTSFEVLQIQEDLTEARSREVSAIITYRKALTSYYRATGRLLEKVGFAIERTEADF